MKTTPVGMIAGSGMYPRLLFEQLQQMKIPVIVAGIRGHANGDHFPNGRICSFYAGQLNKTAAFFREYGVKKIYMAGAVRWASEWMGMRLDFELAALAPMMMWRGDDWALRKIASMFEKRGLQICDAREWIHHLLAPQGQLAGPTPSPKVQASIVRAIQLCSQFVIGDKGQAITVYGKEWVGYEDRRGTTALLSRTPGPGGVLVKLKKKHQDVRFDRPAIGPSTVKAAKMVGVCAIVVEANEVLLLNKERLFADCNQLGVSLMGY